MATWIYELNANCSASTREYRCSECGCIITIYTRKYSDWTPEECPNCGVIMKQSEE